ncbi:efflux RND transporter periplasmic adaptor subunit [Robiginitalea marina]|uniref:Efflux RND transporter periplasmic adaptor subunit n=1 Tax=Robiginitalea marina TaxID=2954105 RepID=A0ABT1B157_9FLAO|nr:efflux RND transporter periplasmic adaptor subunit [Robiginitalea marina]MCO5725585.1 efflux RND transporter periplasmic adaptor subunit [Robiginitalea marina]
MKSSHKILILLALSALPFSCREGANVPEASDDAGQEELLQVSRAQFEANGMALGSLISKPFPRVIRVSGMLDVPPENRVVVSAVYGGYIKNTTLLVGDRVRKGQVVVTLENPEFLTLQQSYLEAREQLPYLKSEFERQQTLLEEKISSEKLFLKAQSDYLTILARKGSLEEQLKMLGIPPGEVEAGRLRSEIAFRAPIDGKVTRVDIRKGAYVSPAAEIMEIVNQDHLHLELSVFEKDIAGIRIGQPIRFTLPEVSNKVYQGSVYLIGSTIQDDRTVKVHGHLSDEEPEAFLVGMFVQAEILAGPDGNTTGEPPESPALPEEAILSGESGSYVLVATESGGDGYAFRREPVEAGATMDGFTALTAPGNLREDDRVLVKGAFLVAGAE